MSIEIVCQCNDNFIDSVVSGNGPDITEKFHQRIFAMYKTLQSRDVREGSGIGLAWLALGQETR